MSKITIEDLDTENVLDNDVKSIINEYLLQLYKSDTMKKMKKTVQWINNNNVRICKDWEDYYEVEFTFGRLGRLFHYYLNTSLDRYTTVCEICKECGNFHWNMARKEVTLCKCDKD